MIEFISPNILFARLFIYRYEVSEEGGCQTLSIKDLTLADAGEFTCQIGDRETSAKLQVDEGNK